MFKVTPDPKDWKSRVFLTGLRLSSVLEESYPIVRDVTSAPSKLSKAVAGIAAVSKVWRAWGASKEIVRTYFEGKVRRIDHGFGVAYIISVFDFLKLKLPYFVISCTDMDYSEALVYIELNKTAFVFSERDLHLGTFASSLSVEQARNVFVNAVWELAEQALKIEEVSNPESGGLLPYKMPNLPLSGTAIEIFQKTRKYLEVQETQVLLFIGPPGTGKTTTACQIVQQLETGSLLVLDKNNLGYETKSILLFLQAKAVIIDDVDRAENYGQVLEMVDYLRGKASVVIITANDLSKLDHALLRPGRVDFIYEFKEQCVQDTVVDTNIQNIIINNGRAWEAYKLQVGSLPISYRANLLTSLQITGISILEAELERLTTLANFVKEMSDDAITEIS